MIRVGAEFDEVGATVEVERVEGGDGCGCREEGVAHAPELGEGFEREFVMVLDEGAGGFGQGAQTAHAGEDLSPAVVDDHEETSALAELWKNPGAGEVVESGEIPKDEPSIGRICFGTET